MRVGHLWLKWVGQFLGRYMYALSHSPVMHTLVGVVNLTVVAMVCHVI